MLLFLGVEYSIKEKEDDNNLPEIKEGYKSTVDSEAQLNSVLDIYFKLGYELIESSLKKKKELVIRMVLRNYYDDDSDNLGEIYLLIPESNSEILKKREDLIRNIFENSFLHLTNSKQKTKYTS